MTAAFFFQMQKRVQFSTRNADMHDFSESCCSRLLSQLSHMYTKLLLWLSLYSLLLCAC